MNSDYIHKVNFMLNNPDPTTHARVEQSEDGEIKEMEPEKKKERKKSQKEIFYLNIKTNKQAKKSKAKKKKYK
jgi:hypothetical protein